MRNAVVIETENTMQPTDSAETEVLMNQSLTDDETALGRQDSNLQLRRNTGRRTTGMCDERPAVPSENPDSDDPDPDRSGYQPVTNRQFPGETSNPVREALCQRCDDDIRLPDDDLCADCRREIDAAFAELPGATS